MYHYPCLLPYGLNDPLIGPRITIGLTCDLELIAVALPYVVQLGFVARQVPLASARIAVLLTACAIFGGLPATSNADIIIYFLRDQSGANPRGLYNFDTSSGTSTLRAAIRSVDSILAFDVRPSDGAVFAVALSGDLLWIARIRGKSRASGTWG